MTQSIQSSPDQSGDAPEGEDVVVPAETDAENATTSADAFEEGGTRVEVASTEGSLVIDIDGFEGPLDVLLALARNQKVDLAKIAILPLAEQYL